MTKIKCSFVRLRDYPACFEDCPDTEQCPHRGVTSKDSLDGKRGVPCGGNGGNAPTSPTLQVKDLSPDQIKVCPGRYECLEINQLGEYPFKNLVEFEIAVAYHCEQCEALN